MKVFRLISSVFFALLLTVSFSACGDDDDSGFSVKDVVMTVGDTYIIKGGSNYIWTSLDPKIVSVEDNEVKAHKVGESKITCEIAKFKVTVKGLYNLYEEPCIKWGEYMSEVRIAMIGYTQISGPDGTLQYKGKNKASNIFYEFENEKLVKTEVQIAKNNVNSDISTILAYLKERYVHLREGNGSYFYETLDGKTNIILSDTYSAPNQPYKIVYEPK